LGEDGGTWCGVRGPERRAEGSSDVFRSGEGGEGVNYWYFRFLGVEDAVFGAWILG
jgi:hypothetical protein